MIVSHRHKFVFIKTRKTAGTSFEAMLIPHLGSEDVWTGSELDGIPSNNIEQLPFKDGHTWWTGIDAYFKDQIGGYRVFTIERNPWDKCVSGWHFHRKIKPKQFSTMSFDEYTMNKHGLLCIDHQKWIDAPHLTIFKYENLDLAKKTMEAHIGIRMDEMPVYKKSERGPYQDYYVRNETIERVRKQFAHEIEVLGYEFESNK